MNLVKINNKLVQFKLIRIQLYIDLDISIKKNVLQFFLKKKNRT